MAVSVVKTNNALYVPLQSTGCSLSSTPYGAQTKCPPPLNNLAAPVNGEVSGTVTNGAVLNSVWNQGATPPQAECVHLPSLNNYPTCTSLYNVGTYMFYSYLFQDGASSKNYVVTFVPPPAGANVALPSGATLNLTMAGLEKQLARSQAKGVYGTVTGTAAAPTLAVTGSGSTPAFSVNLPAGSTPVNSLAIIESVDGL